MTPAERRLVEEFLRELKQPYDSRRGFTYNEIHDMYDKLVKVGLLPR